MGSVLIELCEVMSLELFIPFVADGGWRRIRCAVGLSKGDL